MNHEIPQELIHGENISEVKPSARIVLINETMPLITRDKKKGTRKNIALTGSLGIPKT